MRKVLLSEEQPCLALTPPFSRFAPVMAGLFLSSPSGDVQHTSIITYCWP